MKNIVILSLVGLLAACASTPPPAYTPPTPYGEVHQTPSPGPAVNAPAVPPKSSVPAAPAPAINTVATPVPAAIVNPPSPPPAYVPNPMCHVRIEGTFRTLRDAVAAADLACGEEWYADALYRADPNANSPLALNPERVAAFGGTVGNGIVTAPDTQLLTELERSLRGNESRKDKFTVEQMVEHTRKRAKEDQGKPYNPQVDHFVWLSKFVLPSGQFLEVERRLIEPTLLALKAAHPTFTYEIR